jgi:uncharacterized membrane protein
MNKLTNSRAFKNFISYFIQGFVVLAPVVITAYIFYRIFEFLMDSFHPFKIVHPLLDPFIFIAGITLLIYIFGRITSSLIFTPLYIRFEKDIERVPLIRGIYSAVKDILSAFMGSKKKFNRPVLVTIDKANNIKQLGFITRTDLTQMSIEIDYVAVYLPFTYSLSGKLIIVHKDNVTPLDASSTDVLKFIITGGVTTMD